MGQDTHYWNNHYGSGGFFIPGAVVAWTGDSAVLFYNPALLVNAGSIKISVNATAYFYEKIRIRNGAGTGFHLQSINGGSNPLLVAGNIRLKKNPRINLAYGLISEPVYDFHVTQRRDQTIPVLDDSYSPGAEFYVGQMKKQNTVRRIGAMAGMGFPVTKKLSAGFYLEAMSRRHQYDLNFIGRALVNPPGDAQFPIVSSDLDYFVSYTHYGIKARAGLAYEAGADRFGLTIQSPLLRIGGTGTIVSDMVIANGNFLGLLINLIANARQEKLKTVRKEPFSIALGYSRQLHRVTVYAAAEFFPAIDEYNILTPREDYFIRPDTGNNDLYTPDILKLKDARKSVFNFSLGANYVLNPRMILYTAFRTDNSYFSRGSFNDNSGFVPYTSTWDLYHVQGGLNIKKTKFNLRAGLYASFGVDKSYGQDINFDNPSEGNFLQGEPVSGRAGYFNLGFLLSYIHNF